MTKKNTSSEKWTQIGYFSDRCHRLHDLQSLLHWCYLCSWSSWWHNLLLRLRHQWSIWGVHLSFCSVVLPKYLTSQGVVMFCIPPTWFLFLPNTNCFIFSSFTTRLFVTVTILYRHCRASFYCVILYSCKYFERFIVNQIKKMRTSIEPSGISVVIDCDLDLTVWDILFSACLSSAIWICYVR